MLDRLGKDSGPSLPSPGLSKSHTGKDSSWDSSWAQIASRGVEMSANDREMTSEHRLGTPGVEDVHWEPYGTLFGSG